MNFYAYMVGQIYILNNPRNIGILCSSFKNSLVIFSIPLVNINSKKIVHFGKSFKKLKIVSMQLYSYPSFLLAHGSIQT